MDSEKQDTGTSARTADRGTPLIPILRDSLELHTREMGSGFLRSMVVEFRQRGERHPDHERAALLLEASEKIDRQQEALSRAYAEHCLRNFNTLLRQSDHGWKADLLSEGIEALSLIPEDDLEENLAINKVAIRIQQQMRDSLFPLEERIGQITRRRLDPETNPVGPISLCRAFSETVRRITDRLTIKLILYKRFELYLLIHVEDLYEDLNNQLITAGVLPDLALGTRTIHNPESHYKRSRAPNAHQGAGQGAQHGPGVAYAPPSDPFEDLRQHFRSRRLPSDLLERGRTRHSGPPIDTGQVLASLATLQPQQRPGASDEDGEAEDSIAISAAQLKGLLKARLEADGQPRPLDADDEDTIDMVSMLFDFILDDENLCDPMRALLGRLQIPIVKVAITDNHFFQKARHPARRFLNELACQAMGWSEPDGRGPGGLYAQVKHLVTRVLDEFQDDSRLFDELLEEFHDFLGEQEEQLISRESLVVGKLEREERLSRSRTRAREELATLLQENPLPADILKILQGPWLELMAQAHARSGELGPPWRNILRISEVLLWSLQPKHDPDQRRRLGQTIPALLKAVRSGLKHTNMQESAQNALFEGLENYHLAVLRGVAILPNAGDSGEPANVVGSAEMQTTLSGDPGDESKNVATNPGIFDESLRTAETFAIGQWMEFSPRNGHRYRARLAWRSPFTERCLFVRRNGSCLSQTTGQLAHLLRSGQAVALANAPLIDRAMAAMTAAIHPTAAGREIDTQVSE